MANYFSARRAGGRGWQFPQGGMRRGESAEDSLYRELNEEIGLQPGDVQIVGRHAPLVALPPAAALPATQRAAAVPGPEAALVSAAVAPSGPDVPLST